MNPLQLWRRLFEPRVTSPAPPPAPAPAQHPSDTDIAMMRRALSLAAAAASQGEVPVGAVVYRTPTPGDSNAPEVLGEAFNLREANRDPSAHAEFSAILQACKRTGDWRLNDCSLAVTLEPCPMCAGLIVNARVGRLIYGASDPKAGAAGSLMNIVADPRLNHRAQIFPGVLADDSAAMLRNFFRTLRSPRPPA